MPPRSAVVVVIDRWGAGFLGPYGNTWLDTRETNRLASRSLVCETVLANSPDLGPVYRSYLTGRHSIELPRADETSLAALAAGAGLSSVIVTDEPEVAGHPLAAGFGQTIALAPQPARRAKELDETTAGRLFLRAIEQLQAQREPGLLWVHSRGMAGPWDAPLELRRQFSDEDDPEPPDLIDPPEMLLAEDFDPDLLLGLVHAYAGQVALVDACLGSLLDALDEHPQAESTLLVVTSPRGYPLGEHRRVGTCDQAMFGELLQVPLIVRRPGGGHERSQRIKQPADLFGEIADWLQLPVAAPQPGRGDLACAFAPGQRAIRTPAWFMRQSQLVNGEPLYELFAKPDDRWEANEVASHCREVVELLSGPARRLRAGSRHRSTCPARPAARASHQSLALSIRPAADSLWPGTGRQTYNPRSD